MKVATLKGATWLDQSVSSTLLDYERRLFSPPPSLSLSVSLVCSLRLSRSNGMETRNTRDHEADGSSFINLYSACGGTLPCSVHRPAFCCKTSCIAHGTGYRFHFTHMSARKSCSYLIQIYQQGDVYYVHYFDRNLPGADRYHGKEITHARFRSRPSKFPEPRLIRWHYKQCLMARIRGFAVNGGIPATSAEAMLRYGIEQ